MANMRTMHFGEYRKPASPARVPAIGGNVPSWAPPPWSIPLIDRNERAQQERIQPRRGQIPLELPADGGFPVEDPENPEGPENHGEQPAKRGMEILQL